MAHFAEKKKEMKRSAVLHSNAIPFVPTLAQVHGPEINSNLHIARSHGRNLAHVRKQYSANLHLESGSLPPGNSSDSFLSALDAWRGAIWNSELFRKFVEMQRAFHFAGKDVEQIGDINLAHRSWLVEPRIISMQFLRFSAGELMRIFELCLFPGSSLWTQLKVRHFVHKEMLFPERTRQANWLKLCVMVLYWKID